MAMTVVAIDRIAPHHVRILSISLSHPRKSQISLHLSPSCAETLGAVSEKVFSLRRNAVADGRIVRWRFSPSKLRSRHFHTAFVNKFKSSYVENIVLFGHFKLHLLII